MTRLRSHKFWYHPLTRMLGFALYLLAVPLLYRAIHEIDTGVFDGFLFLILGLGWIFLLLGLGWLIGHKLINDWSRR